MKVETMIVDVLPTAPGAGDENSILANIVKEVHVHLGVANSWHDIKLTVDEPEFGFTVPMSELRSLAEAEGYDFDEILSRAAENFTGNIISPRSVPLTDEEADILANDDDEALRD